ncbi:MAG TPA: chromate transporter [Pseudolabrys sp.]|nr:chromate transporter [Pseudolabrys sp.]
MPDSASAAAKVERPSLTSLFFSFVGVSLSGFGGALPWARRMIVDRRGWMTADEFNEAFSLAQFLPGANVVNFSIVFGQRFGGAPGAAVALAGLLGPPVVIVTLIGVLYAYFGDIDALGRILSGISSAAAGLIIAMVAKMGAPLFRRGLSFAPFVALAGFVAVGLLRWPLPLVLIGLAPISVALAWMRR